MYCGWLWRVLFSSNCLCLMKRDVSRENRLIQKSYVTIFGHFLCKLAKSAKGPFPCKLASHFPMCVAKPTAMLILKLASFCLCSTPMPSQTCIYAMQLWPTKLNGRSSDAGELDQMDPQAFKTLCCDFLLGHRQAPWQLLLTQHYFSYDFVRLLQQCREPFV